MFFSGITIRFIFALLLAATGLPSAAQSESSVMVFPGPEWQTCAPGAVQLDSAALDSAMRYLAMVCGPRKTDHSLIIKNGFLVYKGRDIDTVISVWSCTKSFCSAVLGLLIDEKKCSLSTIADRYVPALRSDYPAVTLRHFTTMCSGVQSVAGDKPFEPGKPLFTPGGFFHYGDDLNMFGLVLSVIAGESIAQKFKRCIADPIGMDSTRFWWGDWGEVNGIRINGGSGTFDKGVHISAREMARFGWLLLNGGTWNGRQLISSGYVHNASRAQPESGLRQFQADGWYGVLHNAYGYNFWTNTGGELWPAAPRSTFAIQGNNNNICIIVPDWSMVIVRLGDDKVIDMKLYDQLFVRIQKATIR